ncbi:NADH-flavin reductase [Corynebacterium sp. 13CS0277]|uniref:NAD(P)-dependent oxidoreductase n=1 Tax=Corynebacterium sp. 13CS0277 TaxID=2071994 RepID=UPI000D045921|nr:NAD(P)H-binding protein [Corynebacterium sp. 13CS0277]PRQ12212.1 NADH-flavin reductase [Corynebacterium sp. 13CS0277]
MRIAVIAASGKTGRKIVDEAVRRGFDVTAITRKPTETGAQHNLVKDIFELTAEDLAGFDVVADAFGAWTPETLPDHTRHLQHLAGILAGTPTRLIVVGGAGSLFVDEELTTQLKDTPDFPEAYKPIADAQGAGLDFLRTAEGVNWTYLSPAADFQADGPAGAELFIGGEQFTVDADGNSTVSYADYARALVDEIANPAHAGGKRFSVRNA